MELPFFSTTSSSSNSANTRAEALRWLAIGEKLLAGRDLVGSKSFAARARESDPTLLYADQIIAVAETLMAGDNRINNLHDWYSVLQLSFQQSLDGELIANQYRKLAVLLNPQNNKLPFADQAFALIVNAWQVLSNPSKKAIYDNQVLPYLGVNPNPMSSGFNPLNAAMNREQFNHQPFEISFQVMPQQQHASSGNSEQVMQQQPQFGVVREPPPSMMVPQQHLSQEPMHQQQPQQTRKKEPMRQPMPQLQPQPQPQPQPMPVWQTPPRQPQAPAQPPWKESAVGNNVTHNFSGIFGDSIRSNNERMRNDNASSTTDDNVDNANGNIGASDAGEEGRRADESPDDGVPSFWTACPYCYYMFEYPTIYEDCALKCQNCKKAFQGVPIPSPPPVVDGQDVNFCCWGMMPLGISMRILERNQQRDGWTPFSPMFNLPKGMGNHGPSGNWPSFGGWSGNNNAGGSGGGNVDHGNNNAGAGRGNMDGRKRASGPRVYVDDEDVFLEYSDASEDDDGDWRTETRRRKAKTDKRANGVSAKASGTPNRAPGRRGRKPKVDKENNKKEAAGVENVEQGIAVQEGSGVGITATSTAELTKKGASTVARRHSIRVAKDFGKLDLNVEFNNEGEEPAPRVIQANGVGRGMEDIIEGGGFFEGLDEFLSSLPILNVVGVEKVKAA